jgi:gliding motility-associated-like protein
MIEGRKRRLILSVRFTMILLLLFCATHSLAQPANDNCQNISVINVPNNGFGKGTFTSTSYDISQATIQTGETFAPAILVASQNKKSMWYRFSISTTRAVRVTLAQPGTTITAGDAGFAVYKINSCLPTNANISTKLTPIATFGNTYHPCVDSGVYFIQVSSNNNANGSLYVEVQVSDTTGALYDRPAQAYQFGVANANNRFVDYFIGCQSVEDANERCNVLYNASQYHKSSWHTFTTPAYFDYISIMLSKTNGNYFVNSATNKKFGYTLYKGNAVTAPLSSLITVDGCDSLLTNGYYAAYKMYRCDQLEPNTTYTIQLFAHETFNDDVRLGISTGGVAPTQAPVPVSTGFPASNNFGTLVSTPAGPSVTLNDQHGCNSRHSVTTCNPAIPANGLLVGTTRYNLSSFFTFSLNTTSSIYFYATPTSCGPNFLLRVFKQGLTTSCTGLDTANLVGTFVQSAQLDCLAPGAYTIQVLGTDTIVPATSFHYNTTNTSAPRCLLSNLGGKFSIQLRAYSRQAFNKFSLSQTSAYDTINKVGNAMAPLVNGITYQMKSDTFGCNNTVLPVDTSCSPSFTKAMYREFIVADSGIVNFTATTSPYQYKLYRGNASTLATAQGAFNYPQKITGLTSVSRCMDYYVTCSDFNNVCVTPGTYTYTTFAGSPSIGAVDRPSVTYNIVKTTHYTPALAQDMGSILDSVSTSGGSRKSDIDFFSCKDNAEPINGYLPCLISNVRATKAIYRQFYLKDDALVSITATGSCGFETGPRTLFSGKATDGLTGLTPMPAPWNCFTTVSSAGCRILPKGWYTVVSYGVGPTYENPLQNVALGGSYGSYIGMKDEFTITVTICTSPKYNRPYKASVATNGQPHTITSVNRVGSTPAYPRTDTTYSLPTEGFNCIDDTPFIKHPIIACETASTKVAYYVFKTISVSYLEISTGSYWGAVYPFDVRTDSSQLSSATPIQPCVKGNTRIQLCSLPAGVYTLVIFAPSSAGCSSVSPTIYVDIVRQSRFDHAKNAYDFGVVPPDSTWYRGKAGDVNPQNPLRAPSSDFFYCTTGTQPTDPTNASCMSDNVYNMYDPSKYYMYTGDQGGSVDIVRRNLWYTFVIDKPGSVYVKVENKTPGKTAQYRFAVYKSDVSGNINFNDVVSQGLVDSTLSQGLVQIGNNGWPNYCNALTPGVSFYRDPCSQFEPQRYYVLVENRNPYYYYNLDVMNPNNQLEVAILVDSVNEVPPKYDHYYKAYDFGSVGAGTYTGGTDNYSCATRNSLDPISGNAGCTKTLWYKFTSTLSGNVRYRIKVNGVVKYSASDIQLLQEKIPGDSTTAGLLYDAGAAFRATDNTMWMQHCVSPGTWYLILPGCAQLNENVFVEIQLVEQVGDYCTRPVVATMPGAGSTTVNTIINCHTIGTDYGEFNPTVTCPVAGITGRYKSSWFRIDISSTDTLDVTTFISENTNVLPADIKYRMMTGDCNAMQEQSCVLDAQTQNTYKCLTAGSYYIQVFTPVYTTPTGTTDVTGDITLHLSAVVHADTCAPINTCLVNANFIPQFNCTTDTSVRFVNYSTFGSSIQYNWDFGYAGLTSTATSPAVIYPELATSQVYNVTLRVNNISCNRKDSVTIPVTIPARPSFTLGRDTSLCNGGSLTLNATSWAGSTYRWSTNAVTPTIVTTGTGVRTYWVTVTYNGCTKTDTIRVYVNTITPRNQNRYLCIDSVQLISTRSLQETHLWSTGETTSSIWVYDTGRYTNKMQWFGCTIRDTFNVFNVKFPFVDDTTSVCFKLPYTLTATAPGATGYVWQNNSTLATFNATTGGKYWVRINYGNCTITDTVILNAATPIMDTTSKTICSGQTYILPSGKVISATGIYRDTVKYRSGCDSLITLANMNFTALTETNMDVSICAGQTYALPWGGVVNTTGTYSDIQHGDFGCDSVKNNIHLTVKQLLHTTTTASICNGETYTLPSGITVNQPGVYNDTIQYAAGCDSLVTTVALSIRPLLRTNNAATICQGQTYTLPSGLVISNSGTYNDTVRYAGGCDSLIATVDLTIKAVTKATSSASICAGENYTLPSGVVVNNPGIYKDTLRYATGCDSLIFEITLGVRPVSNNSITATICKGKTYTLPSGKLVTAAGVHRDTLRYVAGCDSLVTQLTLSVKPVLRQAGNVVMCEGYSYTLPSGAMVNVAGVYIDTARYTGGCDSLISTITLIIFPTTRVSVTESICQGQTYTLPNGTVVNQPGVYVDTVRTNARCDYIFTTTLLVKQVVRTAITASICAAKTYTLPSGKVVSTSGNYADTLRYVSGCDSVINTINLTVQNLTRVTSTASICAGQNYILPSGKTVSTAGTFADTVKYSSGCDSLISSISITIRSAIRVSAAPTICQGQIYTLPSGKSITASGLYVDTLRYTSGCDSLIATVNLTVKPVTRRTTAASLCQGQTYTLPSGKIVSTTAVHSDTIRYTTGCDSLVTTLNLIVQVPTLLTTSPSICVGQTYTLPSGAIVSAAGNYVDVVKNQQGCDSIVNNIKLIVNPNPTISLTKSNDINCIMGSAILTASGGTKYVWSPPTGLNNAMVYNPVASPSATTMYKAQVTTARGCIATDSIQLNVAAGDANGGYLLPSAFTPNGDSKNDCFGVKAWGWVSDLQFTIYDRWGITVFATTDPAKCWDGTYAGVAQGTGAYVYSITANTICGPIVRKGTIVLIR